MIPRFRSTVRAPQGVKSAWDDHFLRRSSARRASDRRLEPISTRSSTDLDEGAMRTRRREEAQRPGRRVSGAPAPAQGTPERERTFPTSTYLSPILLSFTFRRMGERYVHVTKLR